MMAREISATVRATLSPPPRSVRAEWPKRLDLRAHARDRVEERLAKLVDVQRRRQLVGDTLHDRELLGSVCSPLVVLQLEQPNGAIPEPQRRHDVTARVRARMLHATVAQGIEDDRRSARLQRERSEGLSIRTGSDWREQQSPLAAVDETRAVGTQEIDPEVVPVDQTDGRSAR